MQPRRHPPTAEPIRVRIAVRDLESAGPRRVHQEQLVLGSVDRAPSDVHGCSLVLHTDRGDLNARHHPVLPAADRRPRAVVWVGGAGGGLDGPAQGLYPAACARLQDRGLAGLRVDYRHPNALTECILDTLLAVAFLQAEGAERVALVGHSFGGAVVISAGALSDDVTAVVPMSTQTYGADLAAQVSPRPMLLIHGTADEVLPSIGSELVYAAAREPKELKLFAGAEHGLDSVRDELLELLVNWLDEKT